MKCVKCEKEFNLKQAVFLWTWAGDILLCEECAKEYWDYKPELAEDVPVKYFDYKLNL